VSKLATSDLSRPLVGREVGSAAYALIEAGGIGEAVELSAEICERRWVNVAGPTKAIAAERRREKLDELRSGVTTSTSYTVEKAVQDFLDHGLDGRSQQTRDMYRDTVKSLLEHIGGKPLAKLTALDVRRALVAIAETRSDRTVRLAHTILTRAIKLAQGHDLIGRNVSAIAQRPEGKAPGRPSKAMTLDVALQLIRRCLAELSGEANGGISPMVSAYAMLSWSTGIRTEEARALRWSEVDLKDHTVTIIRAARSQGRTKTPSSRRTLELAEVTADALRQWKQLQKVTDGHVFTTATGTEVDHHNMSDQFRKLCVRAGIGDGWVPRELRHSFVSALSSTGMSIEQIAHLAGHSTTSTTQQVYRKELRPVLRAGGQAMGALMAGLNGDEPDEAVAN
jgi:integrase